MCISVCCWDLRWRGKHCLPQGKNFNNILLWKLSAAINIQNSHSGLGSRGHGLCCASFKRQQWPSAQSLHDSTSLQRLSKAFIKWSLMLKQSSEAYIQPWPGPFTDFFIFIFGLSGPLRTANWLRGGGRQGPRRSPPPCSLVFLLLLPPDCKEQPQPWVPSVDRGSQSFPDV